MSKNFRKFYLTRSEAINYLNISEWKMSRVIEQGKLTPDLIVNNTNNNYKCHLYHLFNIIKLKRVLQAEGYRYKNA